MSLVCGQNTMGDNKRMATSFAEFVAENFNSGASLVWDLAGASRVTAAFEVDSIKVKVSFEMREDARAWYVAFEVRRTDTTEAVHSAFAIFNGVFQAVREFIGVREPEILIFATKRDELAGIYRTYLRKESGRLKELGYEVEGPHHADPYMEFVLRRLKPGGWVSS